MPHHGLTLQQLQTIAGILRPSADRITLVGLFGSRALGTWRETSDIDMVLYGPVSEADVDRLYTLFMESHLPVKVDVVAYDLVEYPQLKQHIDRVMQPLFTQEDLQAAPDQGG